MPFEHDSNRHDDVTRDFSPRENPENPKVTAPSCALLFPMYINGTACGANSDIEVPFHSAEKCGQCRFKIVIKQPLRLAATVGWPETCLNNTEMP